MAREGGEWLFISFRLLKLPTWMREARRTILDISRVKKARGGLLIQAQACVRGLQSLDHPFRGPGQGLRDYWGGTGNDLFSLKYRHSNAFKLSYGSS